MCYLEKGLTVIVPVYNVELYVEQCILSILSSNINNLKVIVVDDHGTDNSMNVVRQMATKDTRIKIIQNDKNRGLAYSRNHGIDAVETTHLAFLDSDDWVSPDFYDKLYEASLASDVDISVGNVIYTYPETGVRREEWVSWWSFHSGHSLLDTVEKKQDIIYACACWNKVYRTDFIKKNRCYFPIGLFIEDVPFTFLTTALSNKIKLVKEVELYYRQRSNSIMKDLKKSRRIFDVFKIMDLCYESLKYIEKQEQGEYRKILDHFWIFNLYSWLSAVCHDDYDEFYSEMRKRYVAINIADNQYITPEHMKIYTSIINTNDDYDVYLFGILRLGKMKSSSWLLK